MIRQKHDQFSKQYLGDLLEPDGQVRLNYEIQGVSRFADVYFTPTTVHQHLGLLTQMTTKACLLEPFRKQPSKMEIRQCMLKLFALHGELVRQAILYTVIICAFVQTCQVFKTWQVLN